MTAEEIRGAAFMAVSIATEDPHPDLRVITTDGMARLWIDGFTAALAAARLKATNVGAVSVWLSEVDELVAEAEKAGEL